MTDFAADYERACSPLRTLGPKLQTLLVELVGAEGLRVHEVTFRVKTAASAERKIGRMPGQESSVDDLHDLLGLRVITYFPSDVGAVARLVEEEFAFDAAQSTNKGDLLDPDRFGYLSQHYIAWLNPERAILPEYRSFSGCKVEIQIRSILQHAWAEIEHDLGYKSETAIPRDIRRRFSRLAGLLEIADAEFEGIQLEMANRKAAIREEVSRGTAGDVDLDGDSVALYAQESARLDSLELRVCEAANIEYVHRSKDIYGGRMVEQLSTFFATIGQLDAYITENAAALERFAVRWLTRDYQSDRFEEELPEEMETGFMLFYVWLFQLARDPGTTPDALRIFTDPSEMLEELRSAASAV